MTVLTMAQLLVPDYVPFPLEYDEVNTLVIDVSVSYLGAGGMRQGAGQHKIYSLSILGRLEDRINFYAWEIDGIIEQLKLTMGIPEHTPLNISSHFMLTNGAPEDDESYAAMYAGGVNFIGKLGSVN